MLTLLNSKTLKAEIGWDGRIIIKVCHRICVCVCVCVLQIQVSVVGYCEHGNEPSDCLMVG